jgi:uncharacterized protein
MSLTHQLLRTPFFGRFEVPWAWPAGADPSHWERVGFRSGNGARLAGLCAMARPSSPYRVAVLEGVFPTLPEFWHHYPAAQLALRISQVIWPPFEPRLRPEREATRVVGRPRILLVHSSGDRFTPPVFGERMLRAFDGVAHASLYVPPGDEHTFAFRDCGKDYRERVMGFLTEAFGAR